MFLSESGDPLWETEDFHEFTAAVKSECSEYLDLNRQVLMSKNGLWRGMHPKHPKNVLFSMVPRKDRKPMNLAKVFHDLTNEYFQQRFGFEYRSKSVFCSRSKVTAAQYGPAVLVFPVNGYKLCASDGVYDFYNLMSDPFDDTWGEKFSLMGYVEKLQRASGKSLEDEMKDLIQYLFKIKYGSTGSTSTERFLEILDYLNYFETKKVSEINKTSEVLIKCDKYFGVFTNRDHPKEINDLNLIIEELYDL